MPYILNTDADRRAMLEMIGVVVFAYALLSYLAAWKPDFRVRVRSC